MLLDFLSRVQMIDLEVRFKRLQNENSSSMIVFQNKYKIQK